MRNDVSELETDMVPLPSPTHISRQTRPRPFPLFTNSTMTISPNATNFEISRPPYFQVSLAAAIVDVSSQSDLVNASLEKRRHSIGMRDLRFCCFVHMCICVMMTSPAHLSPLSLHLMTRPEQLTSVRRLLKKLQFMFELPSRMRRAIALDALAEAVQ
jgi:hypothetical protein